MKKIKKLFPKTELLQVALILAITIPIVIPLLRSDFFHFSDEVHITNMYEMYKAINAGQIPPRMAPDMSWGFGYPLFNYYYVLPYYLGVFFYYIFHSFVTSHNLSPILIMPWFFIFFFLINENKIGSLYKFILGLVLGIFLAGYWFFPAIIESLLLKPQPQFNFIDHYPFIRQLIYSKWGYGASNPGIGDDISFQIGFANLLLILMGAFYLFKNGFKQINKILLFTLISITIVIFMMNIRSTSIWNLVKIANYIQFPWRLLLLTTFFTSFLAIFIKNRIILILLILLSLFNIQYFKPSEYFSPGDDYFLRRYFANQSIDGETKIVSGEYPAWLEDYAILPNWVEKRADFLPKSRFYSDSLAFSNYSRVDFTNYKLELSAKKEGTLWTFLYYFPGWTAYLNNKKLIPNIQEPYGTMVFDIPSGNWTFQLKWEETPMRKFFDFLSLTSLIIISSLILYSRRVEKIK